MAEQSVPERVTAFWMQVRIGHPDECWPWEGYAERGYGKFYFEDRMFGAHELAVTFTTGERRLPSLDTCHSCDNPICCNPKHLRFDTRQSNVDDMFARGRQPDQEKRSTAKLSRATVKEIRERRAMGAFQKDLAAQYGVSGGYISEIVNGLAWSDAGGPIIGKSKRTVRTRETRTNNERRAA